MIQARFKPVSNQADWSTAIQFNDKATGTPIDITGGDVPNSFTLALQLLGGCNGSALQGTTATGELTLPSLGILQIYFPVTRMQALTPGSYRLGLSVSNGTLTTEIALGLVPVVNGIVGQSPGSNRDYA